MKIAFCFLTRSNLLQPAVWMRFFSTASQQAFAIYCHPREAAGVTTAILQGRIIASQTPTQHGHVSIVAATLNLFEAAYADDPENEYFVLVSESTIPIVPFETVAAELRAVGRRSLIHYSVPPPGTEHYERAASLKDRSPFSAGFFFHDQWIVLHRRHVELLLDRPALDLFEDMFAPDEHYFMNALVHARGAAIVEFDNRRTTYVNWNEREIRHVVERATGRIVAQTIHPKTYDALTGAELLEARRLKHWFFRKISAACDCSVVFDAI